MLMVFKIQGATQKTAQNIKQVSNRSLKKRLSFKQRDKLINVRPK